MKKREQEEERKKERICERLWMRECKIVLASDGVSEGMCESMSGVKCEWVWVWENVNERVWVREYEILGVWMSVRDCEWQNAKNCKWVWVRKCDWENVNEGVSVKKYERLWVEGCVNARMWESVNERVYILDKMCALLLLDLFIYILNPLRKSKMRGVKKN